MAWPYATFVNNLAGMSVSGVTRAYTEPPRTLNTVDLPAMWPRLPEAENSVVTLTQVAGLRSATVELVIALEPYQQSTQSANFAATIAMLDAIETALVANATSFGIDRWIVRQELTGFTETIAYWSLIVSVQGSGT